MNSIKINGKLIFLDEENYLISMDDWSRDLANKLASDDGIILNEYHWLIIDHVREFYHEFGTTPSIRMLISSLDKEYGKKIGNSLFLHNLFPLGAAKQASKYAGLKKPVKCL